MPGRLAFLQGPRSNPSADAGSVWMLIVFFFFRLYSDVFTVTFTPRLFVLGTDSESIPPCPGDRFPGVGNSKLAQAVLERLSPSLGS